MKVYEAWNTVKYTNSKSTRFDQAGVVMAEAQDTDKTVKVRWDVAPDGSPGVDVEDVKLSDLVMLQSN